MAITLLTTSLMYSTAFAQESEIDVDIQPMLQTFLVGTGAVVSEDDHGIRSHFEMNLIVDASDETSYEISDGKFVAANRDYVIISDTWTIKTSDDKTDFEASGVVEDIGGILFDVELQGEKIRTLDRGVLYSVTGSASNGEDKYDLFYISALFDELQTQDAPNEE